MTARVRRPLSHVGGKVELVAGSEADRAMLSHALDVSSAEEQTLRHVHGFHGYAARMHPDTARRLIDARCPPQGRVIDPFSGSGTVLVEARLAGRHAFGADINPLAVELGWLKTHGATPAFGRTILEAAEAAGEHAEARRAKKAGPTRLYGAADRELYDVHVLLELDGLKAGITEQRLKRDVERAVYLVLSAVMNKVTRRGRESARGFPSGFTLRFFGAKARELVGRLTEFTELLSPRAPKAEIRLADARHIEDVRPGSIDLIVTSPPYAGVYDYHEQHATRLRWLELEERKFARSEIGARRQLSRLSSDDALELWSRDFGVCLEQMHRVLSPTGALALVIADSLIGDSAVHADALVARLASSAGLRVVAHAAQARPQFHPAERRAFGRQGKREHLLLLERAPVGSRRRA